MYSIDGVPLSNPANGWRLKRGSEPWVSRGLDRPDFNASNRDGTTMVRGHVTTPVLTLVVRAPGSSVEVLRRLLRMGTSLTLTSNPNVELFVQAVTVSHTTVAVAGGGLHEVTVVYRAPDVWWRDVNTTDWVATVPSAGGSGAANMAVLPATTGHVTDVLILVQGGMVNPKFAGGNGTWLSYAGTCPQNMLLDTVRGRCWSTPNATPWDNTGSVEHTDALNSGSYPYFLELFPNSTGSVPPNLAVSWDSVPGPATITVRGKNAYDR